MIESYESVKSYKFMNLDYVLCYQAKSAYKSEKITWRCLVGQSGDVIPLGELDLSPYSSAVIEYSVAEKFDAYGGGTRASLIFSSGEKGAQTGDDPGGLEEIGRARLSNGGSGGFLYRRNCTVDLSATSYSGDVFLTAEIEKGQKYIIHNIVFITNEGYEPPEAPTEEATETQDVPGTDGRDSGAPSGGCSSSLSGAAAASFASAQPNTRIREVVYGILWDLACADGVVSAEDEVCGGRQFDDPADDRRKRRSPHLKAGQAQMPEDKAVV